MRSTYEKGKKHQTQGMRETNQSYATLAEILFRTMPGKKLDEVPPQNSGFGFAKKA